jgi:hypothetical protein
MYQHLEEEKINKLEEISHATEISDKAHQEKQLRQRFYKRRIKILNINELEEICNSPLVVGWA